MEKWFKKFKILLTFVAHVLTAVVVFCVVGAGAWLLHVVRHWLQVQGLDDVVLLGMHALEILLFACDVLATGFWATMSLVKAVQEIMDQEH